VTERLVAIHQPNFFPWLGYFDKLARCDLFIVMDNAQFSKTGGTWSNRVKLLVQGKPTWVTMPIVRAYHGVRTIREMEINNATPWRDKLLGTIQMNYRRAPCFDAVYPVLADLVATPGDSVTDYNLVAITGLARALGLDTTKLVLGSTLDVQGKATDLLVNMVRAVGGTAYLCGGGVSDYQEDEKLLGAGLRLAYQQFRHPVYSQAGAADFVPGLSIVDALMNVGFAETAQLIQAGNERAPRPCS